MPNNSGSAESGSQVNPVNLNSQSKLTTILGLYHLIQKNYIIDHIIPKPPTSAPAHHGKLLRVLVALSSVLVRDSEVVAVAVAGQAASSDELSVIASVNSESELDLSNFITCQNSRRQEKQKFYSIIKPKIKPIKLFPYLLENW
jgi:hypothetical protein